MNRAVDIAGAGLGLALAAPVLALAAAAIKLEDGGPVLYRQRRVGRHGVEFELLKLRTMVVGAERQGAGFAVNEGDARITRVGRVLRRLSLDELPQLFNVLRGEMSLIGPRPIVERELAKYAIYGVKLLSVKPGLSGLWQVCGRSETTYPQRVMMDMHYIDHRGLRLDLQLLLLTTVAVLRRAGAC